ncbi:hypothetical protein EVAR_73172_1 [Eumeta japonica]|uniref:SAP domain-containing protein n=1 Tax=Eumeta variegata TaxID=151549 RepID=A0A4C1SPG1_EUMVA|nr:hypothetical protein EVAR_73172_1 [Eumeta japonica]
MKLKNLAFVAAEWKPNFNRERVKDCTMKFDELSGTAKKELAKLNLPTAGNKVELQKRLMKEFKRHGQDTDSHDFDDNAKDAENG